jgi:hypothetical protein
MYRVHKSRKIILFFKASVIKQSCQIVPIFSYQKSQFGYILEGLAMENAGICIIWAFGIFCGHFGKFCGHLV